MPSLAITRKPKELHIMVPDILTVLTVNLVGIAPLYRRYPGQTGAQPAYIQLTEDGDVSADYNGEIGNAVPMAVWHQRALRWHIPSDVTGQALLAFLLDAETQELLGRVHYGHSIEWDGNNYTGHLDNDAKAASEKLELLIERSFDAPADSAVWAVGDWLWSSCTLLQHWTTQPLAEAVAQIEADAEAEGVLLDGDVEEALLETAWYWIDTGRAGLTNQHITALLDHGRINDAEATTYAVATLTPPIGGAS